jgi:CDP-2,3-bis-(O-geranylgeranyl)-sn-glycerol synthase
MFDDILFALWFFLPAGMANMIPIPIAKMPGLRKLDSPLDFGAAFRGKRIFGSHKTWRGLIAGIIVATLTLWLQQYAVESYGWFAERAGAIDYLSLPTVWLGLVFAIGALGGDAIKSFFKRRRNKAPGQAWLPYDLVDHIVGAAVLTMPFVLFDWWVYPVVFVIWLLINLFVSYSGYLIQIKERPL